MTAACDGYAAPVKNYTQAKELGAGSKWCTAYTHTAHHCNEYMTNGRLFVWYKARNAKRPSLQVFVPHPNVVTLMPCEVKNWANGEITVEDLKAGEHTWVPAFKAWFSAVAPSHAALWFSSRMTRAQLEEMKRMREAARNAIPQPRHRMPEDDLDALGMLLQDADDVTDMLIRDMNAPAGVAARHRAIERISRGVGRAPHIGSIIPERPWDSLMQRMDIASAILTHWIGVERRLEYEFRESAFRYGDYRASMDHRPNRNRVAFADGSTIHLPFMNNDLTMRDMHNMTGRLGIDGHGSVVFGMHNDHTLRHADQNTLVVTESLTIEIPTEDRQRMRANTLRRSTSYDLRRYGDYNEVAYRARPSMAAGMPGNAIVAMHSWLLDRAHPEHMPDYQALQNQHGEQQP